MVGWKSRFYFILWILIVYTYSYWQWTILYQYYFYYKNNYVGAALYYIGVILAPNLIWWGNSRWKVCWNSYYVWWIFIILIIVYLWTTNFVIFFIIYELFLLPSFIIVFLYSPNRRAIIASVYFLIWTQIGSFLVFMGVIYCLIVLPVQEFTVLNKAPELVSWLFFIGFGIKIPIWPFHYWLTKTHVEAPTFFSIYLSSFLVKIALYGLWMCSVVWVPQQGLFTLIAFVGVLDASVKMFAQNDLKKLIAYTTIQEMNLILILIILGDEQVQAITSLFLIFHALISAYFFGLVDSIYKRFNSRLGYGVSGVSQINPQLSGIIIFGCLLFNGLPFTIKFTIEVWIYLILWNYNYIYLLLFNLVNWVAIISFWKHWLEILFGLPLVKQSLDLTKVECFIYMVLILNILVLNFFLYLIM